MAKKRAQNIKLGVFVVLGSILLVVAAYLIGNRQNMFGSTFKLTAVFKNVNGLQNGNNVRFSGINVGTVNRIEMINDTTIKVHMIIDEKIQRHIKKDAVARVGSDGLVGSMLINIFPGEGTAAVVEEGDQLTSYTQIATRDMLTTLNTTNENAALLTADLLKITSALNNGDGALGKLLNDKEIAVDLKQTIHNLRNTSHGINETLTKLNSILSKVNTQQSALGVLINDSISAEKMRSTLVHLENTSSNMEKTVTNLNLLIDEVHKGDGTLNYLIKDTTLVNQLKRTVRSIELGSENFNENMEALKHNFLTRRYFKRLQKENDTSKVD